MRIWCYAPGYQEPDRTSLKAMRELTGFHLKPVTPAKATAQPTAVGKNLGLHESFGADAPSNRFSLRPMQRRKKHWPRTPMLRGDRLAACRRRHFALRRSAGAYFGAFAAGCSEVRGSSGDTERLQRLRQRTVPGAARLAERPAGNRYPARPARFAISCRARRSAPGPR